MFRSPQHLRYYLKAFFSSAYPGAQSSDLKFASEGLPVSLHEKLKKALKTQGHFWKNLTRRYFIRHSEGFLLHSGGDFDAALSLFFTQALFETHKNDLNPNVCLAATLSRPGNALALRYTAGIHKRGLPLHQYTPPFQTIAFPHSEEEYLSSFFETHLITPTAERIEITLREKLIEKMPKGAVLFYSPKSFSPSGFTIDEWLEKILQKTKRKDLTTIYVSGFMGAKAVFNQTLPYFHLGFGSNNLEKALELASFLTGQNKEDAKKQEGENTFYVFENLSLKYPLKITVFADLELCKSQVLYSIYKNTMSVIQGWKMFYWLWAEYEINPSSHSDTPLTLERLQKYHQELLLEFEKSIESILTQVEGIHPQHAIPLPPVQEDARESWKILDFKKLIFLIQELHQLKKRSLRNPLILEQTLKEWKMNIQQVFSTRNPAAGAALAASIEALRAGIIENPYQLIPENVTYEGVNTAIHLDRRLTGEQMEKLPENLQELIRELRPIRLMQIWSKKSV